MQSDWRVDRTPIAMTRSQLQSNAAAFRAALHLVSTSGRRIGLGGRLSLVSTCVQSSQVVGTYQPEREKKTAAPVQSFPRLADHEETLPGVVRDVLVSELIPLGQPHLLALYADWCLRLDDVHMGEIARGSVSCWSGRPCAHPSAGLTKAGHKKKTDKHNLELYPRQKW